MDDIRTSKARIEQAIRESLRARDPEAQVTVQGSALGWVRLRVISRAFADLDEEQREDLVNETLAAIQLNLGMYPFGGFVLVTPEENKTSQLAWAAPLPLWSEVLMEPEPEQDVESSISTKPLTVTFYSFKGGVGRSTALAITAGLLSERGLRVVLIDFDLEAPGLTAELQAVEQEPRYGVVDYIYQRWLLPDSKEPMLEDCIRRVGRPGSNIFLIPTGAYDENYIHRLAGFDMENLYRHDQNPLHQLLDEIKNKMEPDVILIDARTGFNDLSAVALLDLADLAIVCFAPSQQSYRGLQWILEALRKRCKGQGKPEVRFVLTPFPLVKEEERVRWLAEADDKIDEYWSSDDLAKDIRTLIYYQPSIPLIGDVLRDVLSREQKQPQLVNYDYYKPLTDFIWGFLPGSKSSLPAAKSDFRNRVLEELAQCMNIDQAELIKAEGIRPDVIPQIFQRTSNFPTFVLERTMLIRGAKGTGKSLLFRLFTEQPNQAKVLASQYADLQAVDFIGVHGTQSASDSLILTGSDFDHFEERAGQEKWARLWPVYSLFRVAHKLGLEAISPPLLKEMIGPLVQPNTPHESVVSCFVEIAQKPEYGSAVEDALRAINQQLAQKRQKAWLFYDGLDVGFGATSQSFERRRRALQGLLSWWLELGDALDHLKAKIFIREDIWQGLGSFPNRTHYTGRDLVLEWQEDDLWRLLLRQLLASNTFKEYVEKHSRIVADNLDSLDITNLRKALYLLWGEQQSGQYAHRWVLNHIADSQGNWFPRSLVFLVARAVEIEKHKPDPQLGYVLQLRSLQEAMPKVSEERVAALKEEYPELDRPLFMLSGKRSPLSRETLSEIWRDSDIDKDKLIEAMLQAGIFERRPATEWDNQPRYAVAELYLSGLGMHRKGRR